MYARHAGSVMAFKFATHTARGDGDELPFGANIFCNAMPVIDRTAPPIAFYAPTPL
jgi:hypothetical protein